MLVCACAHSLRHTSTMFGSCAGYFFHSFACSLVLVLSPVCASRFSKHMKIYANVFQLCNWIVVRKWKRNYADTMVIYSLWLVFGVFFIRFLMLLLLLLLVLVVVGRMSRVFYVAMKKEFWGQVFLIRSGYFTFAAAAVFYWSSNCKDSNESYYLTASWMKPKSRCYTFKWDVSVSFSETTAVDGAAAVDSQHFRRSNTNRA